MPIHLFPTCLIDSFFPEIAEAVSWVLTTAGEEVASSKARTCCGQPAWNAGYPEEARPMARFTLEILNQTPDPIVVPSGSCTAMIRHVYPELFAGDPIWEPVAKDVAFRTYELTQYLVDQVGLDAFEARYPGKLHYFPSCHSLRGLGLDRQPLQLLSIVQEAQIQRLPAECCGFGGLFALEHSRVSAAMLERSLRTLHLEGAEAIVGTDVSCLMQLEGGLRRVGSSTRCSHIAQILAGHPPGLR